MDAWEALSSSSRASATRKIVALVSERLKREAAPYYPDNEQPRVSAFAADTIERGVRIHFIADHDVYNTAQSGSDWADHYIVLAEAVIADGQPGQYTLAPTRRFHNSELEHDDYNADEVLGLVRDEALAKLRGMPFDAGSIAAALARMKAVTEEKIRAACARAEQAQPERPAEPATICPKCGSSDAGIDEVIFELIRMRCSACGLTEVFDHWDRDYWC